MNLDEFFDVIFEIDENDSEFFFSGDLNNLIQQ